MTFPPVAYPPERSLSTGKRPMQSNPRDLTAWLYEITGRQALAAPNQHDRRHWTEVGDEADEYDHTQHESGLTLGVVDRIVEYERAYSN